MNCALRVSLLIGLISSALFAQSGTYKISGTVLDHATNQPLPKVLVQIASVQGGDAGQFTRTNNEGQFAFANLLAGKYTLLAGHHPSHLQLFQGEDGFSTAIAVGPGLDSEHVVFPLPALGAISGTILDEDGAGLRNATVYLYWQHVESGQPGIAFRGIQQTKPSGSFRFSDLQPGVYFLAVHAQPWYAANNATDQEFDVAYPLTYYADTTDASSASPIPVTEGATVSLQMALHPTPAIHVRLSGVENKPGVNLPVTVAAIGPGGQRIALNTIFTTTVDGHQELSGMTPGRYELSIYEFENGHGQTVGTKTVDLQNGSDVDVSRTSSCSITGHITFVGVARAPDPLRLYLKRLEGNQYLPVTVAADGTFQISVLPAGRYQLGIDGSTWFHFQSVDVKGGRFKDGSLELADGVKAQIFITASVAKTDLNGIVLNEDKPVAGATVLLFPEDPDRNDLLRRDQSDSDGTFTLPEVAPGRYRVLAINNGHDLAYADAAVIKPYLLSAQAVTVSAGKQPALKVTVQNRLR